MSHTHWETVIGLEVHVELNTRSKIFSQAPNHFGDEPNTNISEVCTGQPGALPVLNREAVRKAVQFGCAVNARIATFSTFDRKSYFYPDSPRNFQITQFERPIVVGGYIHAKGKKFTIHHAHLEDDTGMLKHFNTFAGIDYNRAGVPLIEIVSDPCIHSPEDAVDYAMEIRAIMKYLDASDCNMEEGSLRIDANVSVRPHGEKTLRNKVEVKNMNSFANMQLAIESEVKRQIQFYTENPHGQIGKGTYRFDPETKSVVLMRQKEEAMDYRYFPEPDLPPIILTDAYIDEIRRTLPELPQERFARYTQTLKLPEDASLTLINDKALSDYFEEALTGSQNPKSLSNWLIVEFTGRLKEKGLTLRESGIPPAHVGALVNLIESGKVTGKIAKKIADEMVLEPGKDPEKIVASNPDYAPLTDTGAIEALVDQVVAANPESIADYRDGKGRAFDFLVGQVMKLCKGAATPATVRALLEKKLK